MVALANDVEGILTFRVTIDVYGEVVDCDITKPSGIKVFDQRACDAVSTRAKFYPAFDAEQNPVQGTFLTSVRWQIAGS